MAKGFPSSPSLCAILCARSANALDRSRLAKSIRTHRDSSGPASIWSPNFSAPSQVVVNTQTVCGQLLGAQVPIAAILQKPGQGQTLARRPEAHRLQPLDQTAIGTLVRHVPQYNELGRNLKANTVD